MCFAKVKISSFNPAFVVPEEHLESVEEHFHRCWVHTWWVHSQCLQPCKRGASAVGPGPKHTTLSQTITSCILLFMHHSWGCFRTKYKDIRVSTKNLQTAGGGLSALRLWLMGGSVDAASRPLCRFSSSQRWFSLQVRGMRWLMMCLCSAALLLPHNALWEKLKLMDISESLKCN